MALAFALVGALLVGEAVAHGGDDVAYLPSNCSGWGSSRRVRVAPGSLHLNISRGMQLDGAGVRPNLVVGFGVEVDANGDGSGWRRLSWGELLVHHDRKMHVVLVGADYNTFVHFHPVCFTHPPTHPHPPHPTYPLPHPPAVFDHEW